jgi:hypothetical protein
MADKTQPQGWMIAFATEYGEWCGRTDGTHSPECQRDINRLAEILAKHYPSPASQVTAEEIIKRIFDRLRAECGMRLPNVGIGIIRAEMTGNVVEATASLQKEIATLKDFASVLDATAEKAEAELSAARQAGFQEGIEAAAKAMCEWCREGKPISEPLYGRINEVWHILFPDVPHDSQRVRCQAEAIRSLKPVESQESKKETTSDARLNSPRSAGAGGIYDE